MLIAEGFWPVAPVRGRSEGERLLLLLPVACPVETFGVILIVRIASVVFWDWFYCFNGAYVYIYSLLTKNRQHRSAKGYTSDSLI